MSHSVTSFVIPLLSILTLVVLICLVALIDSFTDSFPKALLFFLASFSAIYQLIFIVSLPFLFTLADGVAILLLFFFRRRILIRLKGYSFNLFIAPYRNGEIIVYVLYSFIAYLFFLSVFSVPGWDWDSMIFHLPRPFLYLNEKTVFTTHFSDARQTVWPMGSDVLFYLFTRHHGSTVGVGFISFLGYVGILLAIHGTLKKSVSPQKALTLVFVAASFPTLVYSATTVKGDPLAVFAFVMLWIAFKNFHETRERNDLVMLFLSLSFGLSVKLTFVFAALFSLAGFVLIEWLDRKPFKLQGTPISWAIWLPFGLVCLLLSQIHLYLFNFFQFHHPMGPTVKLVSSMTWKTIFQNLFKYQLELVDFMIPFSSMGIPFIDTALSWFYNHTIGALTYDMAWHFRYFPQEMNASFGPFGFFLVLVGIYWSLFGKTPIFARVFAWICIIQILFVVFNFPREESISIVRYFSPVFLASLFLLPKIFESPLLKRQKAVRVVCLGLLLFCCTANYATPLIAYHPKAIPWYSYAFTNRDLLYKEKHFFDNRIGEYKNSVRSEDDVLILGKPNVWMYPYYQHAKNAKIHLKNYIDLPQDWLDKHLKEYSLIICEDYRCLQPLNEKKDLELIWQSSPNLPRPAAYFRRFF